MDTTSKLVIMAIAVALFWGVCVWQRQLLDKLYLFLSEVKAELKKVNWPGRKEVISTTTVVIIATFVFGIFLSLVDLICTWLRAQLFTATGL